MLLKNKLFVVVHLTDKRGRENETYSAGPVEMSNNKFPFRFWLTPTNGWDFWGFHLFSRRKESMKHAALVTNKLKHTCTGSRVIDLSEQFSCDGSSILPLPFLCKKASAVLV